ncbi:MAG: M14 family metallopeptidase [Planctomycetota bacterium]
MIRRGTECVDTVFGRMTAVLAIMAAGCASGPLTANRARAGDTTGASQVPRGPAGAAEGKLLDPSVPTPESVIGHGVGSGAVRYDMMVRYLQALADASPYVILTPYAESHEGRTLYFLTVTSEKNHARLAEIKADNAKLADPRKLADDQEAERIVASLPGVAWLAYAIHGDELSSTDAAIQVAYQLAAGTDEATRRLRDELVVHIDPLMNPDGRERFLGQLQHLTGKVQNADYQAIQHWGLWSAGRGNHYLFDLNRDWVPLIHPETRGRAAKILEWNPHLVVDSHEMGPLDTYLFDPPREPLNLSLSEANLKWRRQFSADQAKAFDAYGWSYYTKEWYEEWYPGYTNAWTSLLGAIGLLYEQAGVQAAAVKQATGQMLSYDEAIRHHVVSSLTNIETLRSNRRDVLRDYLADGRWAVSGEPSAVGPASNVFLVPPPADRALFKQFVELLGRHGIEWSLAADAVTANDVVDILGHKQDTKDLPAGTLVVHSAQPHRRLLHALLDFDPHMTDTFLHEERKNLENHWGSQVYDITAWNVSMAYGLEAYWADRVSEIAIRHDLHPSPKLSDRKPGYGYLIDIASRDTYRALVRLFNKECKIRVALKPFKTGGRAYEPGSLLLRNHENPEALPQLLKESVEGLELDVQGVDAALSEDGPDLGGNRFDLLEAPRVALATQWPISSESFGATWHLLDDRIGLRVSPVSLQGLGRVDLRKYNVMIIPDAWGPEALSGVLDDGARRRLRTWVEAGGTLIALGDSAAFVAGKDRGLSSVRLRQEALDELPVYEEACKREQSARKIQVNPAAVWGEREAPPDEKPTAGEAEPKLAPKAKDSKDLETLKREDAWQRTFSPNGVFVAGVFNPEHWLCFGLSSVAKDANVLPVSVYGGHVFMSKDPVRTAVRLADESGLRLSGLLWPEARRRLGNSTYAATERVGYGQIVLFASDPIFRSSTEGVGRMFLNAVLLGPGAGASQTVPW